MKCSLLIILLHFLLDWLGFILFFCHGRCHSLFWFHFALLMFIHSLSMQSMFIFNNSNINILIWLFLKSYHWFLFWLFIWFNHNFDSLHFLDRHFFGNLNGLRISFCMFILSLDCFRVFSDLNNLQLRAFAIVKHDNVIVIICWSIVLLIFLLLNFLIFSRFFLNNELLTILNHCFSQILTVDNPNNTDFFHRIFICYN